MLRNNKTLVLMLATLAIFATSSCERDSDVYSKNQAKFVATKIKNRYWKGDTKMLKSFYERF